MKTYIYNHTIFLFLFRSFTGNQTIHRRWKIHFCCMSVFQKHIIFPISLFTMAFKMIFSHKGKGLSKGQPFCEYRRHLVRYDGRDCLFDDQLYAFQILVVGRTAVKYLIFAGAHFGALFFVAE